MKQIYLHTQREFEYPLEKAKEILERDGIYLEQPDLEQLVTALTLLAQKEAELLNNKQTA